MSRRYERDGVSFQFPETWAVEADDADAGWAVTVQSPATAFVLVSLRPDAANAAALAEEALSALKAEYPDVEAEPAVETVAGSPAVGHDADFLTVDMAVVARTRCIDTTAGPLLILCQVGEYDRPANDPVLRAVVASLTVTE